MIEKPFQIYVSLFCVSSGDSDLHKTPKITNTFDEENTHSPADLFRQSVDHGGNPQGDTFRKG